MDIEGAGMSGRATMIWWVLLLPCVFVRPSEALPISGRVVDYRARPVAGAEVALYEELHDYSADRDVVRLQDRITSTDPNGRFAFTANIAPSYRVFLVARKQGLALGWDVLLQAEGNVIVLERPCVLAGAVVDAAGRPVAAAKVRAVPKSSYLRRLEQRPILGPEPWLAVRTDRQGTFRFDSFAADVSADFWVRAPGRALVYQYTTHPTSACGFEAGRTDIRLVVPQEVAVHGRVIDAETGKPVEGAHVLIHPDNVRDDPANRYLPDRVVSGKDGDFAFKGVPPGRHYINVSPSYDTGFVDQRVRFAVRPDQNAGEVAVMLKRGGAVEIRAREEGTNTPISHLPVYFWEAVQNEQSSFYKHARTGTDGVLQVRAPAGECQFSGQLEGYSPRSYQDQALVTAGRTTKSEIVLRRYPSITGLVLDESGRPVGGAVVNSDPALTDEAGRFETRLSPDDPPGKWIVRHVQRNLAAIVDVEHDSKPAQFVLRPALSVSGRVTDPNGDGIPAARVALHLSTPGMFTPYGCETITTSRGCYEVAAVVPEQTGFGYRISVNASGYGLRQFQRITITGEPGTSGTIDPIVLRPANQSISGVVVDPDGQPAARVPIFARGNGQPTRATATDRDGRFIIRRVGKGPLRIQASFDSSPGGAGFLQAEGGDRDVKIILGQNRVHSRYVSLVGKPLPDVQDMRLDLPQASTAREGILVCFFDLQQRASRHCMMQLAKQAGQLRGMGLMIVVIQAARIDRVKLDKWFQDNDVPFSVGMVQDGEKTRLTWGVKSLPWLILTDGHRIVRAEGFGLGELDEKIKGLTGE